MIADYCFFLNLVVTSERIRLMQVDPSEITKKYAKKMQYLDTVRDGSEGELSIGYWSCDGVAAEVGEPRPRPDDAVRRRGYDRGERQRRSVTVKALGI